MSTRFNRNDANVPDDRLFPDDFIVDQNGQDTDLLQLAQDFGCLPCIGEGLVVSEKNASTHEIEISAGWAYDSAGRRITVESAKGGTLAEWDGTTTNYVLIAWASATDTSRPAHRTGISYDTRIKDSYTITVTDEEPDELDIVLATVVQNGTNPMSIGVALRPPRSCKLISEDKIPGVEQEGETGEPPKPGSEEKLPDLPKGKTVPMPIILCGTRNGSDWLGVETILPETLGRTAAAINALTLERVNLKSGTPLADVKVWIGDWGTGAKRGSEGDDRYICDFSMGDIASGVSSWADDLWINDPPGQYAYYLVKDNESWYAPIHSSGSNWVKVKVEEGNEIPGSGIYYICPYAEQYRSQTFPYKDDAEVSYIHPFTARHYDRIFSPVAPVVLIKELNLGGKYNIKVASVISGDNYTKWAEVQTKVVDTYYPYFIVGSDLVRCWVPAATNLTILEVDGGVQVTIPGPSPGETEPEAYEVCYTFGNDLTPDPATPDFDNPEHPTIRVKDRVFKLDTPPGKKVKIRCRAIHSRLIMRCLGTNKIISHSTDFVTGGGASRLRNRKMFTNPIKETGLAAGAYKPVDQQKLANSIWVDAISLFNPTDDTKTDFEVYVHGSNQNYTAGRKIKIGGSGCDATEIGGRGWTKKTITDYRITDDAMMITILNTESAGSEDFELRYTVEYHEDIEQ